MDSPDSFKQSPRLHGRQGSTDSRGRRDPSLKQITSPNASSDDQRSSGRPGVRNTEPLVTQALTCTPSSTIDDPLSRPTSSPAPLASAAPWTPVAPIDGRPISSRSSRPGSYGGPSSATGPIRIDVAFLTRPSLYRSIPTDRIPSAIVHSRHQPSPGSNLDELLSGGHYRHAAIKAVSQLTSGAVSPEDHAMILNLYHVRLVCLVVTSNTPIAVQESRPLIDWLAHHTAMTRIGDLAERQLVPWDLRLLLHRLQTLASGDQRRSIMTLYQLGSECRASARLARKHSEDTACELWGHRLGQLGVLIAAELLEMGEIETAARHLETLSPSSAADAARKTLMYLRIGNLQAAERCITSLSTDFPSHSSDHADSAAVLACLVSVARRDYAIATSQLSDLHARFPNDELVTNNLAVCQLYTGHLHVASQLLESLLNSNQSFSALLSNMATIYELTTERAGDKKVALVAKVAEMAPQGNGDSREKTALDFKL